jgi:hypothetical protein
LHWVRHDPRQASLVLDEALEVLMPLNEEADLAALVALQAEIDEQLQARSPNPGFSRRIR